MNKQFLICCLFVLARLSLSDEISSDNCNAEEDLLQKCSMALPVLSSPDISIALTTKELDKSCIDLNTGIKCIEEYTGRCMEKEKRRQFMNIYSGITEVVQDLCKRGEYQDEYLKHADCVKNVRPEYEVCSRRYEQTLTGLGNHQKKDQYNTDYEQRSLEQDVATSHEIQLREVCCSFQEYLQCSETTVQKSCGEDAARFTSNFLKRMASNIIKGFCLAYREEECSTPGAAGRSQSTFLATVLTITQLLLYLLPA